MKTIVSNEDNTSKYLLDGSKVVVLKADCIEIGSPSELIVSDLNENNATLHEGVTAPADWVGGKYLYDGSNWSPNPNWVEPVGPNL